MPFTFNFGGFNPGDFGQGGERPQRERKPRKPIGTPVTRTLINIAVTALVGLVYFYVELPALNPHAEEFYFFVFLLCAVYCGCAVLTSGFQGTGARGYLGFVKKQCTIPFFVVIAMIAAIAIGSLSSWVVLRAGAYSKLLPLTTGDFVTEVEEIRYDQIPMLDSDSAARLGSRKLGELADMVSQFEILPNYTQINYKGRPVRVTSLAYGDLIKWFTNRSNGLPAYIVIDMVTQEAEVVRLDEGMKYTTAEHFSRNLYRHLRFQYPTMMFDEPVFEIDEEGTPYWVCSRIVKRIGLFGGTDVKGAVLVNAVSGESQYYEDVPTWVDRLYSSDIIMDQYDYYGQFHNGFLNAYFGQRDVTLTTDGLELYRHQRRCVYVHRRDLCYQRPVQHRLYPHQPAHQGDPVLPLRRCDGDLRQKLRPEPGPADALFRHLPAVAEYRRPAHLLHGFEGRGRSGEDVCHGERPTVQYCGDGADRGPV